MNHSKGSFTFIHGMRAITVSWVILGHTFLTIQIVIGVLNNEYKIIILIINVILGNTVDVLRKISKDWHVQVILNANISVDTFFVLSGFLTTWLFLKQLNKQKNKLNVKTIFVYFFHRIWRLTTLLGFLILFYTTIFKRFLIGPGVVKQQSTELDEIQLCKKDWWASLFFIANLLNKRVS